MKRGCLSKRIMSLVIMTSVLSSNIAYAGEIIKKDQTVYVNLSHEGKVENEIVSNWIHSNSKINNVEDVSTLKDITNVKGEEIPKVEGNKLIWNSDEKDIFYQGKTDKKIPIKVDITYYLDGKEIEPLDLAGKSGKVKIKINFRNLDEHIVKINGEGRKIYTPFTVVTALNLPIDKFENVELSDGELISDGNNQAITFVSFPGLSESLQLEKYEDTKDINIPENLEITADVKNFEMGPIMITATPELLTSDKINKIKNDMGHTGFDDNKIQDKLDKFDKKSYLKDLVRRPDYVFGERQLINDSFTMLNLDTSLLDFAKKYTTSRNIDLARRIKDDIDNIDYNYILDDPTIKKIPDYMTDENVDKARSIIDDTKKLQDIDMDRFDPMIDLLDDSDRIMNLKDYAKSINDNIDQDKLNPLLNLMKYKDKIKDLFMRILGLKKVAEDVVSPAVQTYIESIKDVLEPKIEAEVTNARAQRDALVAAQNAINEYGVVPDEAKDGVKTAVNAAMEQEKTDLKNIAAKTKLTDEDKQQLLYVVDTALNTELEILPAAINSGSLDSSTKEQVKQIIDKALETKKAMYVEVINSGTLDSSTSAEIKGIIDKALEAKKAEYINGINNGTLTSSQIREIENIIDKVPSETLSVEAKSALKAALESGKYKENDEVKATISNIVNQAIDSEKSQLDAAIESGSIPDEVKRTISNIVIQAIEAQKSQLDTVIESGTIPDRLKDEINNIIVSALSYEKQTLDTAISSGSLDSSTRGEVDNIIDSAIDTQETMLESKIDNDALTEEDKETLNTILTEVIKVYDEKLEEASEVATALNSNGSLTKSQLQIIMPLIVDNNEQVVEKVKESNLDDDSKTQINAMYNLIDGLLSNSQVLDGIVSLQDIKLDAEDILKHNDMNDVMDSIDYADGLASQLLGLKKYLDVNQDIIDKADAAFKNKDDIDYLKDTIDDLKEMKKDIDDNKDNIDFINELLDKNDDPKLDGMREKLEKLRDDMDEARPILDSMQDEIDEKNLDPKFDDLPDLMDKFKKTKDDLEKNRHILELMRKALLQDNIDEANELLDALEDFRSEYTDGKAVKDKLVELADNYESFTGIGENMDGKVKFVMKTDEIKAPEVKEVVKNVDDNKGGFIQWLKNLFHIK